MIVKNLYYLIDENNTQCYLLELPNNTEDYILMYRLIAENEKLLTKDNKKFYSCIDITQEEYWNNEWQEVNNLNYIQQEEGKN